MNNNDKKSLADFVMALQASQTASTLAIVHLLIDKGIVTPEEIIGRFRQASEATTSSDLGLAASRLIDALAQHLEQRFRPEDAEAHDKSH